jgi:hypothetical protein
LVAGRRPAAQSGSSGPLLHTPCVWPRGFAHVQWVLPRGLTQASAQQVAWEDSQSGTPTPGTLLSSGPTAFFHPPPWLTRPQHSAPSSTPSDAPCFVFGMHRVCLCLSKESWWTARAASRIRRAAYPSAENRGAQGAHSADSRRPQDLGREVCGGARKVPSGNRLLPAIQASPRGPARFSTALELRRAMMHALVWKALSCFAFKIAPI